MMTETVRILHETALFDYFGVTAGDPPARYQYIAPTMSSGKPEALYREYAAMAREAVSAEVPILLNCNVRSLDAVADVLDRNEADFVSVVRAQIADPQFIRKSRLGEGHRIQRCVGANQGCLHRVFYGMAMTCTANPSTGYEGEWSNDRPPQAEVVRRVLVIGGGPAGMKFAQTAARRGHTVTLVEREDALGGQVRAAAMLPGRERWMHLIEDLEQSLVELEVDVRRSTMATIELIESLRADETVVATGARWMTEELLLPEVAPIPGVADAQVIDPISAIKNPELCGSRVVIVDETGDYLPVGLAELLAGTGRSVHIITPQAAVGSRISMPGTMDMAWVAPRLMDAGVEISASLRVVGFGAGQVLVESAFGETPEVRSLQADTVILASSRRSDDELFRELRSRGLNATRIGDCLAPREVDDATSEGMTVALTL